MSDSFALALFVMSVAVLVLLGIAAITGQPVGRSRTGLIGVGFGLAVQAIGHLIGLATGHHPAQPIVQVAYLAVSVAVVPVGLSLAAPADAAEPDRWTTVLLLGLTAAISAVLILRIQTTWRPADG